ncbi:MAG TPA: hypothetical protein VHU87_11965 [Rhizomicrobium sp.]|jgi:hypothetical protein|nr:hypothetical protein [Rhizomicrobium sp.]
MTIKFFAGAALIGILGASASEAAVRRLNSDNKLNLQPRTDAPPK